MLGDCVENFLAVMHAKRRNKERPFGLHTRVTAIASGAFAAVNIHCGGSPTQVLGVERY